MITISDRDLERVSDMVIDRLEIVIDGVDDDRIELYILDELGQRVEGGTFNKNQFIDHIMSFYNANF